MNYWHQKCIAWNVIYWFINRYRTNYVLQLLFIHILSIQSYEFERLRLTVWVCWVYRWSSCKMIETDSLRSHPNFDNRIAWRDANRTLENSELLFLTSHNETRNQTSQQAKNLNQHIRILDFNNHILRKNENVFSVSNHQKLIEFNTNTQQKNSNVHNEFLHSKFTKLVYNSTNDIVM